MHDRSSQCIIISCIPEFEWEWRIEELKEVCTDSKYGVTATPPLPPSPPLPPPVGGVRPHLLFITRDFKSKDYYNHALAT